MKTFIGFALLLLLLACALFVIVNCWEVFEQTEVGQAFIEKRKRKKFLKQIIKANEARKRAEE